MNVRFKHWDCVGLWHRYSNGRFALQLVDADTGEPIATATVNIPPEPLEDGEIIIKSYSENEGMVDALVKAGVIEKPHRAIKTGWVQADVAMLKMRPDKA
jgi:hypothetical protein